MECTSGTPGNNIGIVGWDQGCQHALICSLSMLHVSHPYLVSLSFYTIPFFEIRRICLLRYTILSDNSQHFYYKRDGVNSLITSLPPALH